MIISSYVLYDFFLKQKVISPLEAKALGTAVICIGICCIWNELDIKVHNDGFLHVHAVSLDHEGISRQGFQRITFQFP